MLADMPVRASLPGIGRDSFDEANSDVTEYARFSVTIHSLDRKEVAGGHGLPVRTEEGLPRGALGTYWRRVESMGFENRGDGRAADVMAEVAERFADTCVAPAGVFSRHAHNERLNFTGGLRAAR
ncbi:hypothetical protein [Haliangium ochraceum]|uniref:hypothetical protein n=1 Tax=Haliangium ochraceum TaxID=80816 RepID=UPI0018F02E97|nr:hypothetical protein [Haliangium ochraceum]